MRVGIYLGYQPKEMGGGYTYLESLTKELINYNGRHDFYFFYHGECFPVPDEDSRLICLDEPSDHQEEIPILSFQAIKHKIDVFWFMVPNCLQVHVPFICTVWDLEHRKHPFFPEVSETGWTWDSREDNYRDFLPRAAYVITGTEKGKEEIHDFYGVLSERIKVFPFPTPKWVQAYEDRQFDMPLCDVKSPFLFYPAQFWPHKNHIVLLHALKILAERYAHEFHLVFTGSDMGNLDYVTETAKNLGVQESIHFEGFVDQDTLAYLYKNAFALVYPSFFGPDNLPPLEAFAFGCPVLAASILGSHEHLKEAAILFDPRSGDEIAENIHALCLDDALRENLIEKGHAFSKKRGMKDNVADIISLLDEFELYRSMWSRKTLYRHFSPQSSDIEPNRSYTIDDIYATIMSDKKRKQLLGNINQQQLDDVNQQKLEEIIQQLKISEATRVDQLEAINHLQRKIEQLSSLDAAIRVIVKIMLRKFRLYDFYFRHRSFFRRMYKKVLGKQTLEPLPTSLLADAKAVVDGTLALLPIKEPIVEAFIVARIMGGEMSEKAIVRCYELGEHVRTIMAIAPSADDMQGLYMLSRSGVMVTCVACANNQSDIISQGFSISSASLSEWMLETGKLTLADFDALFLGAQTAEHDLLLLIGRLSQKTRLLLYNAPDNHLLRLTLDAPDQKTDGLEEYSKVPQGWLDHASGDENFYSQRNWPWAARTIEFPASLPSGRPWPKISVVTVTLNQGSYLEETLRSVLSQGYPNLEYIVLDGGSTDQTPGILKRYESELAYCVREKDEGQADALNKGFKFATGDIMAWLNSDDCYQPGALWRVALAFDSYGADIVAGGCALRLGNDQNPFRVHHNALPVGKTVPLPLDSLLDIDGSWQKGAFFYQPEVFWSRSIWEKSGGQVDANLFYSMDYELWVRFAASGGKIVHIPDTIALFRTHEGQKTSGQDLPFLPELRRVNAELRARLKQKGVI